MRSIRTAVFAALTAAIAIAPLASAEAHKRHRHGGDVAAAIALGLFAAGVASRAHRHSHRHHIYRYGNRCYGLHGRYYRKCIRGGHYGVPHGGYYPNGYYYRHGGGLGGGHILKNGR